MQFERRCVYKHMKISFSSRAADEDIKEALEKLT